MRANVTVLALHRHEGEPLEYEDAVWVGDGAGRGFLPAAGPACHRARVDRPGALRIALADGAAESLLARRWAELLVRACGAAPTPLLCEGTGFAEVLARAADRWPALTKRYLVERDRRGMPVQPYELRKLDLGAHASAVLAAHVAPHPWLSGRGQWAAAVLGDAYLFQVRGDRLWRVFPTTRRVDLVTSNGAGPSAVAGRIRCARGTWTDRDRLFLANDAAGAWFLRTAQAGGQPWEELGEPAGGSARDVARWAGPRRRSGELGDGDLTIVRIDSVV
ncbi:hypothetical protein [Streptomyces sp. SID3343]|uniref:hypothetical protein n=1 Tax=Streptomyces sp. SID3343 TaxID=2690260 RepID=UPI00136FEFD6|nr:hypothetical protein [Streptomyces sp. SID3343]MYW01189.1 hypothetical protein [Streptomyces sp. SID3343]